MTRSALAGLVKAEPRFRWRGSEVTRIESFSDAVFAFSVTLLVVSLEVPRSYAELLEAMRGFPAFGVCFAVLVFFWHSHVLYFRRYGLQTSWVVALNSALLFCLLFYIYPLKFLFSGLFSQHPVPELDGSSGGNGVRTLFAFYGFGYAAINVIFLLLYAHAWRLREALALDAAERLLTRKCQVDHIALMGIGLVSVGLATVLPANLIGLAGMFYFMIPVYFTVSRPVFARRLRRMDAPGRA